MWLNWGTHELPDVAFSPLRAAVHLPPAALPLLRRLRRRGVRLARRRKVRAGRRRARCSCRRWASSAGAPSARGPRLVAAGIAAFYPELVWFVSHFWAETVFTVLLWWAIERTTAADERGSLPLAVGAGALFGLATLTRETVLYFLPVAALWLAWRRAGGGRRAAAFLVAVARRRRAVDGAQLARLRRASCRCRPRAPSTSGRATRG